MTMTKYELPDLEYDYSALEPHIDARTMELHHQKHHAAYLKNLLATGIDTSKSIEEILLSHGQPAVQNNGGGYYNHSLFWKMMSPDGGGAPTGELKEAIENTFGSFEKMKEEFANAAKGRFGSGWAWLLKDKKEGTLRIESRPNQDHPDIGNSIPILGLDVWEHAYYLKYQNRRPDYIEAWWNVVNWSFAKQQFNRVYN